jgi:glycosyltransferase involved in cell wall biosynthesis
MTVILDARVVKGSGGGPDKTIINSPAYLAPHGYRMLCAYMHAPEDAGYPKLQAKAAQKGVELISIPDRGPFDHKVINHTLALCRKEKVTVWHGHDYKSNLLGLIIYPMYPMRLVTTVHGWVEKTNRTPLYYWIDRSTLRFYEKVICVSDDLYEMSRQAGVPKSRCVLLENGIDVTDFQRRQSVQDAKVKLGINPNHFLIGAVGRLSGEKGFDLLIKSIDTLLSQGQSQLQLAIFGEGKEAENLQKQINELGRQDQIKLMGFQTDLRACYEAMDLFVLSSLREGLPNVVLEAMAMEVPVVSTRVAGIPKLLTHDINGYLLDAGSSEALTSAIGTVISDKQRLDRFRHEGRRTVETRFNFAIRMEKLRLLYDELLQKPKAIAGAKQ